MAPITWQNVAAPDLTDSARLLQQGSSSLSQAFQNLGSAFNPIKDANEANYKKAVDQNTAAELDALNSIQDLDQLKAFTASLTDAGLRQKYGNAVDTKAIIAARDSAANNLMTRLNTQFDYDQKLVNRKDNLIADPLEEQIASYVDPETMLKDMPALQQKIGTMQQGGKLMAAMTNKYQSLVDQKRNLANEAEARAQRNTTFNQQQQAYNQGQLLKDKMLEVTKMVGAGVPANDINNFAINSGLKGNELKTLLAHANVEQGIDGSNIDFAEKENLKKVQNGNNAVIAKLTKEKDQVVAEKAQRIKDVESTFGVYNGVTGQPFNNDATFVTDFISKVTGKDEKLTQDGVSSIMEDINTATTEGLALFNASLVDNKGNVKAGVVKDMFGLNDTEYQQVLNKYSGKTDSERLKAFINDNIVITDDIIFKAGKNKFDSAWISGVDNPNLDISGEDINNAIKAKLKLLQDKKALQKFQTDEENSINRSQIEADASMFELIKQAGKTN
jgi:hypothetical protein